MRIGEAVPSRLVGVTRYLLSCKNGREQLSKVEAMMSPSTLKNAPEDGATAPTAAASASMIRKVILECCGMGLCSRDEGVLSLSPDAMAAFPKAQFDPEKMRSLLRQLILRPESEANKDFGYVLTWFMAQNPVTFGVDKGGRKVAFMAEIHDQGASRELGISNDVPVDNFSYWAVYLGFAWKMSLGGANSERMLPDPTPFLMQHLPELLPPRETVSIFAFLGRLAEFCPVFEGGQWHSDLNGRSALPPREAQYLPPALEFALKRLEEGGRLKLVFRADADSLLLNLDGQTQNLSHLERQV